MKRRTSFHGDYKIVEKCLALRSILMSGAMIQKNNASLTRCRRFHSVLRSRLNFSSSSSSANSGLNVSSGKSFEPSCAVKVREVVAKSLLKDGSRVRKVKESWRLCIQI